LTRYAALSLGEPPMLTDSANANANADATAALRSVIYADNAKAARLRLWGSVLFGVFLALTAVTLAKAQCRVA
jgi:hypothetical protein